MLEALRLEAWRLVEPHVRLDLLGQTESLFALSNGHIGLRGNLDEGEPHGEPGSYLNGLFETLPLPYAEAGYGYPEDGQSLINVTDGKLMRILVDDEPLDLRHGETSLHRRTLDLQDGVLRRELDWTSDAGQSVRIRSTRLVSFVQRAVAAVSYEVEATAKPIRIVVQSALVANEPLPDRIEDPRTAATVGTPLVSEYHTHSGLQAALSHRTKISGLRMCAGLDHIVEGPAGTTTESESWPDLARVTVSAELAPGERLKVVKLLAYGWSSIRSTPALRDQVDAAVSAAKHAGWDGLRATQRGFLDEVWKVADIEIEGDADLQLAVRYGIFQIVQASARAARRPIPAKGLTGRGYDGHTFWDMETYMLPLLTYTMPEGARDALLWRHSTLPLAQARAHQLRLRGAAFPWRTISGKECSAYWPAGAAAFHINADIADAVRRYVSATGDQEFDRGPGMDILVETARLWCALGHSDAEGRFRIDGITGPDEYSALADNNTFTNLMAARNMIAAADSAERYPERAKDHNVTSAEAGNWRGAASAMVLPFDSKLGVTQQSEGFTRYRPWDFTSLSRSDYPLALNFPYYLLYSSQVVKQADLVLALYLCGDQFSPEQKRRDFAYYESITARDSTLSAPIQAIVAAETGHLELALNYLREAAFVDLRDQAGNTSDGLHLASLGGTWLAVVAGFGGMRDYERTLSFAPRMPSGLSAVRFRLTYQARRIAVELTPNDVRYLLLEGSPLEIYHCGEPFLLSKEPQTKQYPEILTPPGVSPPPGREPMAFGIGAEISQPGADDPQNPHYNADSEHAL